MKDKIVIDYKTEDYPFERKFLTKKRKAIKIENKEVSLLRKRESYQNRLNEDLSKFNKILKKDFKKQGPRSKDNSTEVERPPQKLKNAMSLRYKPNFTTKDFLKASHISSMGKTGNGNLFCEAFHFLILKTQIF